MAWFGKVSMGNFPDLAGAVNKLSESVKNIEKNFDTALGLEEKSDDTAAEASGIWPSTSDRKTLFEPVMAFMGQKGDGSAAEASEKGESVEHHSSADEHDRISAEGLPVSPAELVVFMEKENADSETKEKEAGDSLTTDIKLNVPGENDEGKAESESNHVQADVDSSVGRNTNLLNSASPFQQKEGTELETSEESESDKSSPSDSHDVEDTEISTLSATNVFHRVIDLQVSHNKEDTNHGKLSCLNSNVSDIEHASVGTESSGSVAIDTIQSESTGEGFDKHLTDSTTSSGQDPVGDSYSVPCEASGDSVEMISHVEDSDTVNKEQSLSTITSVSNSVDPVSALIEVEKVKREMKLMEAALQGAARQAQAKADEIAKLMNENEQLKSSVEELKRKSSEADIDSLRDEYHQRVSGLERKVYALTRERDTLRREQNKRSDAAALLKEKDEIITQVMAEGEELSKKQAAQESTIRKLRAQIREFEEEKQRLNSKLQVEETKMESIKKDKAATEKLLQETIERNQAELATQKEYYTDALNAAKEAEALAEARANNEARVELESRLREASERESMLVQALEELRQTLSRTEQQAVFREDMLRRDVDDLQKRYQASELRYNELVTQVPESTRPLLRQIEAMQDTAARREEVWAGVERSLSSRLQEAEAKAAAAEEKERAMSERLSQSLSRITILETQIACLRTEQTQLSRSLEKERQRASESRQEYLAAMEEAATQEGRAKQLEDEIKELRSIQKHEMQEQLAKVEFLEKELERERTVRSELEKSASRQTSIDASQEHRAKVSSLSFENGNVPVRKLSSASSLGSMEESFFLQASLDSSDSFASDRRKSGEATVSSYFLKSMTPSAFEAALRQKDGELASYISRLASLETIRDSLSEELVNMTELCEKLRAEAAVLPGIRAELEALRRRHSSALELMGERDEALEELRADIADLKEMYREQVDLLVNKIQVLSTSVGAV